MKKTLTLLAAALGLCLAAPSIVWAQAGGPGGSGGGSGLTDADKATTVNSNTQSQINATVTFTLAGINSAIQQGLAPHTAAPRTSMMFGTVPDACETACDSPRRWLAWVQGGGGQSINSLQTGGYSLANYGSQVGLQTQLSDKFMLGISASWQGTNGSLNGGISSTSSVWGIAPYAAWQFDDHWNVAAVIGYSTGWTWLNSGLPYAAAFQNSQWTFQGSVNGTYSAGDFVLAPLVSITYVPTTVFGYTDSVGSFIPGRSTALTRGSIGGTVSLPLNGWQPYVRATLDHDFAMPAGAEGNGDTGGTVGGGATVPITEAIWFSVDGGYNSIGRTGLTLWSATARLNVRF